MILRIWDVTIDHATNKCRPQNEIRDVFLMNNINQKYLEIALRMPKEFLTLLQINFGKNNEDMKYDFY